MPTSRHCTPSTKRDGIWFPHRYLGGVYYDVEWDTTTRKMLKTPFCVKESEKPGLAPPGFKAKEAKNYQKTHKFSEHENKDVVNRGMRNYECEVITSLPPNVDKNYTDRDFLKHHSLNPVERSFNTVYGDSYLGTPTTFSPIHPRYPRTYGEPAKGTVKLNTTTTDQFKSPDVPYNIKRNVLIKTLQPYQKPNPWKFSYNAIDTVPYYDAPRQRLRNSINRYGPIAR